MNFKLKVVFDVALWLFLLGMVVFSAYDHTPLVIMWTGLLILDTLGDFRYYSNIQVVNEVNVNWRTNKSKGE